MAGPQALRRKVRDPKGTVEKARSNRIKARTPATALEVVDTFAFEKITRGTAVLFGVIDDDGYFVHNKAHFHLAGFGMGQSLSCEVGTRTGSEEKYDFRYPSDEVLDLMDSVGLVEVRTKLDPKVKTSRWGDQYIAIRYNLTGEEYKPEAKN